MYRFSSGIDTTLTNKHNYNAELLYNSIDALKDVTTDMLTACNSVLTSTTSIIASNLSTYSEVTQPNIDSVEQLNSIFDMSFDGVSAETTRINTMNTAIAAEYTMYTGGLQDTSSLSKYVMASGIDTSLSTKWNSNYGQTYNIMNKSTLNMFDGIRELYEADNSIIFSNVVASTSSGTSDLDNCSINWSELLPDFSSLYTVQAVNNTETTILLGYKTTSGSAVIGKFDLLLLKFTSIFNISSTAFEKTGSDFAAEIGTSWRAVFGRDPKYVFMVDETLKRVAIVGHYQIYDTVSDDAARHYIERYMYTYKGTAIIENSKQLVQSQTLSYNQDFNRITDSTQMYIFGTDHVFRTIEFIVEDGDNSSSDASQERAWFMIITSVDFDNGTITGISQQVGSDIATTDDGRAGERGIVSDLRAYTYRNGVFTGCAVFVKRDADDQDYGSGARAGSYNLGTNTYTALVNKNMGGQDNHNAEERSLVSYFNQIGYLIRVGGTTDVPNDARETEASIIVGGSIVYQESYTTTTETITSSGSSADAKGQPNGVEFEISDPFGTDSISIKKFITFDGAITDIPQGSSDVYISNPKGWFEVGNTFKPYSWDATKFYNYYSGYSTIKHRIDTSSVVSFGNVVFGYNKPFINPTSAEDYLTNGFFTTSIDGDIYEDGFRMTNTSTSSTVDVGFNLNGYGLVNYSGSVFLGYK